MKTRILLLAFYLTALLGASFAQTVTVSPSSCVEHSNVPITISVSPSHQIMSTSPDTVFPLILNNTSPPFAVDQVTEYCDSTVSEVWHAVNWTCLNPNTCSQWRVDDVSDAPLTHTATTLTITLASTATSNTTVTGTVTLGVPAGYDSYNVFFPQSNVEGVAVLLTSSDSSTTTQNVLIPRGQTSTTFQVNVGKYYSPTDTDASLRDTHFDPQQQLCGQVWSRRRLQSYRYDGPTERRDSLCLRCSESHQHADQSIGAKVHLRLRCSESAHLTR